MAQETIVKGKLSFPKSEIIDRGNTSSVIFKGLFEKKTPVAIKRVLKVGTIVEAEHLREHNRHENIVRYYTTEEDNEFYYIGMELCRATLDKLIKGQYDGPPIGTDKEILLQVAEAVEYLADKSLVFRNINPRSIFVSYPDGNIPPKMKLVDFSISREMAPGKTELSFSGVVRNGHWAAPEIHDGKRYTSAVDVFSAGCVFAYFLSRGSHPFGKLVEQADNIAKGAMTMPEEIKDGAARDLIEQMLKHDPKERIDVHEIPLHPYFWSETKCLEFVQATCSTIEPEVQSEGGLFQELEKGKGAVFQEEWTFYLTDKVRASLFEGKMPMKNNERTKTSLFFLLKAIRNKWVHFSELNDEAKEEFGQPPEGYFRYWASRFPRLLVYTWNVMKTRKDHPTIKHYYTRA